MNPVRRLSFQLYKVIRGASVDSGGHRELSSGFLSDRIREKTVLVSASRPGRLLEVGCGEGIFLSKVSDVFKGLLFGIEPVHNMLMRVKGRFSKKGIQNPALVSARGEELPFLNESFDSVVCINTFHNQPSIREAGDILRDMARVCKQGGCLIFDIRNSLNPIMFLAYRFATLYDPSCKVLPLNTYSFFAIQRLLRSLGFWVEKKEPVFFPFTILAPAMVIQATKGN
jgi:ubiquinone/menaquinone biosynthesis C-methylase UbiE